MLEIKFKNGEDTLTLWPEMKWDDGWIFGWCPELKNNLSVHPKNVIGEGKDENS